jgi:CRP/FNR family transcriptional regulator
LSGYCQDAYEVVRSIGLSHSVSGRLAKFLLASATNSLVTEGVIHAKLVLTHEEIAQLTGTSRETITRILIDFRRMEIAQFRGTNLIIHNKLALERLAAA